MQRGRQRSISAPRGTFGALLLLTALIFGCAKPQPEPEDLRAALAGKRYVGPALTGLAEADDCTVSDDFIPKIRCGSAPSQERLRKLEQKFLARLSKKDEARSLRDSAVVRLAADPESDRVRQATALLSEALNDETDPQARADLLTDLSAAYLLQAETDQSAMELGFALDTALQALELDPSSEAAGFNKRLAMILLGVERADPAVDGPLLLEIGQRLEQANLNTEEDYECAFDQKLRIELDRWAREVAEAPGTPSNLPIPERQRACFESADDRWVADLLDLADREPIVFEAQWTAYREAMNALAGLRGQSLTQTLRSLQSQNLARPFQIASQYFEAMIAYQGAEYRSAERILLSHSQEAQQSGYLAEAATSMRILALIDSFSGEYGEAVRKNQIATQWALRANSPSILAAARSQKLELLALAGREDAAWDESTLVLRQTALDMAIFQRAKALTTTARLLTERELSLAALLFHGRSIALRESLAPAAQVEAILTRGLLLLDLGRQEEAKAELAEARAKIEKADPETMGAEHASAILDLFQGLVAAEPAEKKHALLRAAAKLEAAENRLRIPRIQLQVARIEIDQGDRPQAEQTLKIALDEVSRQASLAGSWQAATSIIQGARPIAEGLLDLANPSDASYPIEVKRLIARYFGLRSGSLPVDEALPSGVARLATFVMPDYLILLVESGQETQAHRVPVSRATLEQLRSLLISQLEAGVPEHRLDDVLEQLSEYLIRPIAEELSEADRWIVVADDVLAGLPFALLPIPGDLSKDGRRILLDSASVSYASDLHTPKFEPAPTSILSVGARGEWAGLPQLTLAEEEAKGVGALYRDAIALPSASPEALLDALRHDRGSPRFETLHIASHFELNLRSPVDSTVVLDPEPGSLDDARLSLRRLLEETEGLKLLVLSACDTGSSIPPAAHGLFSLSQAFSAANIERAVVSYWSLDDQVAAKIMLEFHELLADGADPAEALRMAQLHQRSRHPGAWASFALIH